MSVRFERCSLTSAVLTGARLERCELSACDLTSLVGAEALRGARMRVEDVVAAAPALATALGIEVLAAE